MKLHLSNHHGLRLTSRSASEKVGAFVEDVTFDNFRPVKVKKAKRTSTITEIPIVSPNKFEVLENEECHIKESDETCPKRRSIQPGLLKEDMSEIPFKTVLNSRQGKKKLKSPMYAFEPLKKFETRNPFSLLENTSEEKADSIVQRLKNIDFLQNIRKVELKKCRTCNYKKRSCIIDKSSCSAVDMMCFFCKKIGHFPKSLNCKKFRQIKMTKTIKKNKDYCKQRQSKINIEVREKIRWRIQEIESKDYKRPIQERSDSFNDLIPFLLMYIFLNHDCFNHNPNGELKNILKQAQIEDNKCKSILKLAKFCANKLKGLNMDQATFQKFCTKQLKKIFPLIALPSEENNSKVRNILEVFNNLFYMETYRDEKQRKSSERVDSIPHTKDMDLQGVHQEGQLLDRFAKNLDTKSAILSSDLQEGCFPILNNEESNKDCLISQLDSDSDNEESCIDAEERMDDLKIPQLDGHNSESSDDESLAKKKLYSISCEVKELTQVISFFRPKDFLWKSLTCHRLCTKSDCFLCHMRSTCLRLNVERGRGPKNLKIIEFCSQLNQLQSKLGLNWREEVADLPTFIGNLLQLLIKSEDHTRGLLGIPDLQCTVCKKVRDVQNQSIFELDTSFSQVLPIEVNLKFLIDTLFSKNTAAQCCTSNMVFNKNTEKYLILKFSNPLNVDLKISEELYGLKFNLQSSVFQSTSDNQMFSCFNFKSQLYHQVKEGEICAMKVIGRNTKMLGFYLSSIDSASPFSLHFYLFPCHVICDISSLLQIYLSLGQ